MEPKKEPSYNSLKESLRAANQEARGYLDALTPMRRELDETRNRLLEYKNAAFLQQRVIKALLDLVEKR